MADQGAKEGYLLIDNRCAGLGMVESATYTCSHCQSIIVKHLERTRERGFCRKCNSYVCDACEAERVLTGKCRTFNQIIEDYLEAEVLKNG